MRVGLPRPAALSQLAAGLLLVTSLAVIGLFALLGQYAYPSSDDFCMAAGVRDYGLLPHLWQHYLTWSGRYFGNFLYAAYPLAGGLFETYPAIAGLLILLLLGGVSFVLASLFQLSLRQPRVWLVALVATTIYLAGLRHTAGSLYWMAGSLTYQAGNILLLFTLGLLLRLRAREQAGRPVKAVMLGAVLLIVAGIGTSEINMIVLTGMLGLAWLLQLRSAPSMGARWLLLLLVALCCLAAVVLAPGTAVRLATFPLRHDLGRSLAGSLNMGSWTLMAWIGNPTFVIGSLLLPFATQALTQVSQRPFRVEVKTLLLLAGVTFATPFVLQFPAWWAMGGWPPPRTIDAMFFVFLLNWCLLLGALTLRLAPAHSPGQDRQSGKFAPALLLLLALLLPLVLALNSHLQRAYADLTQRAPAFYDQMMQRHALIRQALAEERFAVDVPGLMTEAPRSIFFNDIRPDWRDWRNVCYASYFGLAAIRLQRAERP